MGMYNNAINGIKSTFTKVKDSFKDGTTEYGLKYNWKYNAINSPLGSAVIGAGVAGGFTAATTGEDVGFQAATGAIAGLGFNSKMRMGTVWGATAAIAAGGIGASIADNHYTGRSMMETMPNYLAGAGAVIGGGAFLKQMKPVMDKTKLLGKSRSKQLFSEIVSGENSTMRYAHSTGYQNQNSKMHRIFEDTLWGNLSVNNPGNKRVKEMEDFYRINKQ